MHVYVCICNVWLRNGFVGACSICNSFAKASMIGNLRLIYCLCQETLASLKHHAKYQRRMFDQAVQLVRPGGVIVYST